MAKTKRLRYYKMRSVPAADAWEVVEEYIADDDIVIVGFLMSCIGRGTDGAAAISKSGVVNAGTQPQDDVLYYKEIAGGAAAAHILSHEAMFYPEDVRPELDEGERLYVWIETGATNIQHIIMYYYLK